MRMVLLLSLWAITALGAADPTWTWKPIEVGGGGFVSGMVAHPTSGTLYARTDVGGAYRWNGSRWSAITDRLMIDGHGSGIEAIAVHPGDDQRAIIAMGTDIATNGTTWVTADGGATWTASNLAVRMAANSIYRWVGERFAYDPALPTVVWYGSRRDGLKRSSDGGLTFTAVSSAPAPLSFDSQDVGYSFVLVDGGGGTMPDGSSRTIYLGVAGRGVYRSTDGGGSWSLLGNQPDGSFLPIRAALGADRTLYVTYHLSGYHPSDGRLYRFPAGGTGTDVSPTTGSGFAGIAVDPASSSSIGSTVLVVGQWHFYAVCDLWRSANGGATWTKITPNPVPAPGHLTTPAFGCGWASLVIPPGSPATVFGCDGFAVWRTTTQGSGPAAWSFCAQGIEENCAVAAIKPPGRPLITTVQDNIGYRHTDGLDTPPTTKLSPSDWGQGMGIDRCASNPQAMTRVGGNSLQTLTWGYNSEDGGTTWTPFASIPAGSLSCTKIAISASDRNAMVWLQQGANAPYWTADGGRTWTLATGTGGETFVGGVYDAFHPVMADQVTGGTFYLLAMGTAGNSWTGSCWRSTDGGRTYQKRSDVAGWQWYSSIRTAPGKAGQVWLAGGNTTYGWVGLRRSADGGTTWTTLGGFSKADAVGFGTAGPGRSNAATYVVGVKDGVHGAYLSLDATEVADATSATWTRITKDTDLLPSVGWIDGDLETFGTVYLATGNRGLFHGRIASATPNQAPTVALTSPSAGASFTAPATVTLTASAADSDGTIAKVAFYQGTTLLGEVTSAPYTWTWSGVAAGSSTVTARATDNLGAMTTSTAVTVTVSAPTTFATKVNFQPMQAPAVSGWLVDGGALYGARNGQTYGWSSDISDGARDRNQTGSPDQLHDTLLHLRGATWEMAVPNGTYLVRVVAGDPTYQNSVFQLAVEGTLVLSGTPTATSPWVEASATVTVTDGRLTLAAAPGASNSKICCIEITTATSNG